MVFLRFIFILLFLVSCHTVDRKEDTILDTHNFLKDFPVFTKDSLINVVVEIPAGTDQKWEVNKTTGHLEWERVRQDSLRIIKFLPYPSNYGFIPQTLLLKELGGDGDPLDVFLLGPATTRGKVVPSRIIGVIKMLDKGEKDDKLIAVAANSHFGNIKTLEHLSEEYPGAMEILRSWLKFYKGEGFIEILSVENEETAVSLLETAAKAFEIESRD